MLIYLDAAGGILTPEEKALLPFSGKLITLEIGVRFLTDYLQGNVYFKTSRPEHNLDRCRNQVQRVRSIESQYEKMQALGGRHERFKAYRAAAAIDRARGGLA